MDENAKRAAAIIKHIQYLNIATVTPEGLPWNTPVYTAYDKHLHFYWLSWKKNQHSINIRHRPRAFVTVYDSTAPAGTGEGVYFSGRADELKNPVHMLAGLTVMYARMDHKIRAIREFLARFPRRVYRFTPDHAWVNGDAKMMDHDIDIRKEVSLSAIRSALSG